MTVTEVENWKRMGKLELLLNLICELLDKREHTIDPQEVLNYSSAIHYLMEYLEKLKKEQTEIELKFLP